MRGMTMKKFARVWLPLALAACAGGESDEAAEAEAGEAEMANAESVESVAEGAEMEAGAAGMEAEGAGTALVNPNLASVDDLQAAGLSADAANAVTAARPFLRAGDLHTAMEGQLGDEEARAAYARVWLPINLNDVTADEIMLIPGVGERMAHEFEEYRPYSGMDEFRMEMGKYVDENEVTRLAMYVYVPIDLNSATREEIMAVPGMTERMAHEFEEYRPYSDLDQFRREIGKYVDENEVARLERYVTIN